MRIIARMPAMSRWLKACTATPARISAATMSACRSEKVRTRSGSSARIFGTSALMKAETRGFSLPHLRRAHRIAGHADDAVILAEEIRASPRSLRSGRRCAAAGTCARTEVGEIYKNYNDLAAAAGCQYLSAIPAGEGERGFQLRTDEDNLSRTVTLINPPIHSFHIHPL